MAGLGTSGSAAVVTGGGYRQFQAAQPKAKGNLLTHLLPTLGGTAGGMGGGALGGAIAGSAILPGVGTVAGGLLGALLGGATGGAAGKVAENHYEHQALGNGVVGAGIENGVLSAGPLRLLKAGKLAATAGRAATPSLEAALLKTGAEQAAAPLKTSVAGKLETFGNKQLASQWGTLDKPTIRATNPMKTVGTLADAGIIKPIDAERVASGLTGSNGVLNQAVVKAVGSAGQVPVHNVGNIMEQAIAQHGLVDTQAASVRKVVEAQLGKLGNGSSAAPEKVMGVMKSIEQRIADLGGKGGNYKMATPERLDQAKALQAVHKELQDSLYKTAGADKNIGGVLTPEVRQQLVDLHPGNDQWAAHVDKNIMSSKTVGQLRSAQAPFVKASQMIDNADANSFSTGGRIGNGLANGSLPGLRGMAVEAAHKVVKDPLARVSGNAARKIAGAGSDTGSLFGALSAPTAKTIIRNEGLVGGPLALANGGQVSADPAGSQGYTPDQIAQLQPQTPEADQTDTQDSNSPFSPANIEANVQQILANGGKMSDATAYLSLVKTMQDLQGGSGNGKGLNSTQQQQASNAMTGLQSLNEISSTLKSNPKAGLLNALPGGSLTHNLTGTGNYNAAIQNATDVIGRLRSGGAISGGEEQRFLSMLPKAFDSPQTAQYKLSAVADLFNRFANPTPAANDPTTLLNALGAQ